MNPPIPVAALFLLRNSIYQSLPGVECYDRKRDALTFSGGMPLVAHPPCRLWGRLRHFSTADPKEKDLALWTVDMIRRWGGVLEHPCGSKLWEHRTLPHPGQGLDSHQGYSLSLDQYWFGHRAPKRTWLYICGVRRRDLPRMPIRLGPARHLVTTSGPYRSGIEITRRERSATPPAFAEWLVEVARRTSPYHKWEREPFPITTQKERSECPTTRMD